MTKYESWYWEIRTNDNGKILYKGRYNYKENKTSSYTTDYETKDMMNCMWMKAFDINDDYNAGIGLEKWFGSIVMYFERNTFEHDEFVRVI